ncbi:MAG TPA: GNAT family N-acetyltransferase [Phnomibacter sp.]|nr:GNAT family N-acetyltransferase [Phnomibacter sp.]
MLPYLPLPILRNEKIVATPLRAEDFERLFEAASDPLIWEQHPNKQRYQRPDFGNYFQGALESNGAYLVCDARTGEVIGSSRYYDWDAASKSISIGYTFFIRKCWGKGYNHSLKALMLDHIFQFAEAVNFYVGAVNVRSQVSIERFGATKTGEEEVAYYGEAPKHNFIYTISKRDWPRIRKK